MTMNQMIAALKALGASRCAVEFSEYTGKWFLSCSVDVSDGHFRTGQAEHRDTPEAAVCAFWKCVTEIPPTKHLVVYRGEGRPDWRGRWNGFMWEEKVGRD